jgi:hypothetical protein
MNNKLLLISLSVLVFSGCSTAYKSGQTPDDVYYSPGRTVTEDRSDRRDDENTTSGDRSIRMSSIDPRWRLFGEDYSYNNSPYSYCFSNIGMYGYYYYNPNYYRAPVYSKILPSPNKPLRMVNLNAYSGLSANPMAIPKSGIAPVSGNLRRTYNNSNGRTGTGNPVREVFSGQSNRTYSPSQGGSGSGSVSRPARKG